MASRTKAKRRAPQKRVTQVPDRSAMPLGREAQMAVANLRQYGADPDCVPRPGIDDNAAQQHWFQTRSRLTKKRVPLKPELAGTLENGAGHRR